MQPMGSEELMGEASVGNRMCGMQSSETVTDWGGGE